MNATSISPELTRTEQAVLGALSARPGRVLTRAEIQDKVWPGDNYDMSPATVDRHIASLRRKLGEAATIRTFYGAGYILIRWARGSAN